MGQVIENLLLKILSVFDPVQELSLYGLKLSYLILTDLDLNLFTAQLV